MQSFRISDIILFRTVNITWDFLRYIPHTDKLLEWRFKIWDATQISLYVNLTQKKYIKFLLSNFDLITRILVWHH
jgi:hypothetical protein